MPIVHVKWPLGTKERGLRSKWRIASCGEWDVCYNCLTDVKNPTSNRLWDFFVRDPTPAVAPPRSQVFAPLRQKLLDLS